MTQTDEPITDNKPQGIFTHNARPNSVLTGKDIIYWLDERGGKFCKVSAWNDPGTSPGKKPFETGWQKNPYDAGTIIPHFNEGKNVGLITGDLSSGLCIADIDESSTEFIAKFPAFKDFPTIVRENAPEKRKILLYITTEVPHGKKWYKEDAKSPYYEFLSTGNQGVVAGTHCSNSPLILINADKDIPLFTAEEFSSICVVWTGEALVLPSNEPETPAIIKRPRVTPRPEYDDDLKTQVIEAWKGPLDVFSHFGWVQRVRWEKHGEWLRVFGHGGLFVHKDNQTWHIINTPNKGDLFDAYWFATRGKGRAPRDRGFYDLLLEMAEAQGIVVDRDASNAAFIELAFQLDKDKQRKPEAPDLGESVSPAEAQRIIDIADIIPCPDPQLKSCILKILAPGGSKEKNRRDAGVALLGWMVNHGEFVQSETEEIYYLYKTQRRLYDINGVLFKAFLYSLTGVNPSSPHFSYLMDDCITAAMHKEKRTIYRFSAWDRENKVLRVSRFDGTIYVLDGKNITEEANGENCLFDDDPFWKPYTPDFSRPGIFSKVADAYFTDEREMYKLALRAWELAVFFPELCPTKPGLVMVGEKGSGKSMTLRGFLRYMFGPFAEVSGIPDKPDGFTAAVSSSHIYVIDNMDGFVGWMRDKIARVITGGMDEYRRLYTNNQVGRVRYRCWLAFTARTPDTLERDDLADRMIIMPVMRIPEEYLKAERGFLESIEKNRDCWWGDVLTILNIIVKAIRENRLQSKSTLRMADWESFGRMIAQLENNEPLWNKFIGILKEKQSEMTLEGDPIADGIIQWVDKNPDKLFTEMRVSELYLEVTQIVYGDRKPSKDWPASSAAFGKRLKSIRTALKSRIEIEWWEQSNITCYRLDKKK